MCRCKYCRGFGVQSPSAYSFIRYVINEHYPYYAYSELEERYEMPGRLQHKLGRLLFRLANYWQPEKCYSIESLYFPYINAGCHKSVICNLYDLYDSSTKKLVVIDLDHIDKDELYSSILPFCNERTGSRTTGTAASICFAEALVTSSSPRSVFSLGVMAAEFASEMAKPA